MNGKVRPVGTLVPPLAAAAAVRQVRSVARQKTVALSAPRPGGEGATGTSYALAVGGLVVAGLGVGGLARTRGRAGGRRRRAH